MEHVLAEDRAVSAPPPPPLRPVSRPKVRGASLVCTAAEREDPRREEEPPAPRSVSRALAPHAEEPPPPLRDVARAECTERADRAVVAEASLPASLLAVCGAGSMGSETSKAPVLRELAGDVGAHVAPAGCPMSPDDTGARVG